MATLTWPVPQPGLLIRYAYLWTWEAEAGRDEGMKDRPCAIVLATSSAGGRTRVIVLPITHTAPRSPADAIELPLATKMRLGLDDQPSWIVVSEANDFVWPGPDLRPAPGQGRESVAYGFLPPRLFQVVRDRFLARMRPSGLIVRTE